MKLFKKENALATNSKIFLVRNIQADYLSVPISSKKQYFLKNKCQKFRNIQKYQRYLFHKVGVLIYRVPIIKPSSLQLKIRCLLKNDRFHGTTGLKIVSVSINSKKLIFRSLVAVLLPPKAATLTMVVEK
jgi:hypothetical protein